VFQFSFNKLVVFCYLYSLVLDDLAILILGFQVNLNENEKLWLGNYSWSKI